MKTEKNVITSFREPRKKLIKSNNPDIKILEIVFNKDDVLDGGISDMPRNDMTPFLEKGDRMVPVSFGNEKSSLCKVVKSFSTDIIKVTFNDPNKLMMVKSGLYVHLSEVGDVKIFIKNCKSDNNEYPWLEITKKPSKNVEKLPEGNILTYGYITLGSPSSTRKSAFFMTNMDKADLFMKIIRKLDYGSIDYIMGTLMSTKDLVKFAARLGSFMAPCNSTGRPISSFAVICAKEKSFDENDDYNDGAAMVSSRFVTNMISEEGIQCQLETVEGQCIQCRPYKSKVMAICQDDGFIEQKINFSGRKVIFLERWNLDIDAQEEFNKLFLGGHSKYEDCILVLCNDKNDKIDFLVNLNGLKVQFDLTTETKLNILDVGYVKSIKDGSNSSVQVFQSLLFVENGVKAIHKIASRHFKKIADEVNDLTPKVLDVEQADGNTVEVINSIAPTFAHSYDYLYNYAVKQMFKKAQSAINKCRFPMNGANVHATSDYGMEFGKRFLDIIQEGDIPVVEVFCPAAIEYFKRVRVSSNTFCGFKYPKMHIKEFAIFKSISLDEMKIRINKSEFNEEIRAALIRAFSNTKSSVIVMPAIAIIKNMLAGMDFDYDSIMCVFDRVFNNALTTTAPIAVKIDESFPDSKKAKEPVVMDYELMTEALNANICSGNKSVGEITNMNEFIISIAKLIHDKQYDKAKLLLERIFKGTHKNKVYVSPLDHTKDNNIDVHNVGLFKALKVCENICSSELSEENMKIFIEDLLDCNRAFQELTINAVKKYLEIIVPYKIENIILASDKPVTITPKFKSKISNIDEDFDFESAYKAGAFMKRECCAYRKPSPESNITFFKDVFFDIREKHLFDFFKQAVVPVMSNKYTMPENYLKILEASKMTSNKDVIFAIKAKMLEYYDALSLMRQASSGLDEKAAIAVRRTYRSLIQYIGNDVRRLTPDMTPEDRGLLLLALNKTSSFPFHVLKEETLLAVIKNFAEIDFCGYKLKDVKGYKVGDVATFVNGESHNNNKNAITSRKDVNGDFVIKELNKSIYACRNIADSIVVPPIQNTTVLRLTFNRKGYDEGVLEKTFKEKAKIGLKVETRGYKTTKNGDQIVILDNEETLGFFVCNDNKTKDKPLSKLSTGIVGTIVDMAIGKTNKKVGLSFKEHRFAFVVIEEEHKTTQDNKEIDTSAFCDKGNNLDSKEDDYWSSLDEDIDLDFNLD